MLAEDSEVGPATDSAWRARRLALMMILLVLVLFLGLKRLIEEERAQWPSWSNRLTPAEHVSGRAPVRLELQPPAPSGPDWAPEDTLATRAAAAGAHGDWLAEGYRPTPKLFGELPPSWPEPWSSGVALCLSNPFLLLSLEPLGPPWRVVPVELTWWPHEARAEAVMHAAPEPGRAEAGPLRLALIAFNALDMGLTHVQLTVGAQGVGPILEIPREVSASPQAWPDPTSAAVTIERLPARVAAHLWASAPESTAASPDLRFDLVLTAAPP